MTWIETPESSNIAGFGYDDTTWSLIVEFKNRRRYVYHNVSPVIADGMASAKSKGKFLAKNIKGQNSFSRI